MSSLLGEELRDPGSHSRGRFSLALITAAAYAALMKTPFHPSRIYMRRCACSQSSKPTRVSAGNACTNEWSCPMTARTYLLVVAATIVLMLLFGLTGKNVATNTTQQNAEAVSGSQNR